MTNQNLEPTDFCGMHRKKNLPLVFGYLGLIWMALWLIVTSVLTVNPLWAGLRRTNSDASSFLLVALGWHFATTLVQKFWDQKIWVTAIDNDLEACRNYARPHDVKLISGSRVLSTDLLDFQDDCIIHADVSSELWLPMQTKWRLHCVCSSAPCPQWSLAGTSNGLDSFEGLLFAESIALCKLFQPKVVIVEQVSGFSQHPHKRWILKTVAHAGFRVLWSKTIGINPICPTHRPRWVAIL